MEPPTSYLPSSAQATEATSSPNNIPVPNNNPSNHGPADSLADEEIIVFANNNPNASSRLNNKNQPSADTDVGAIAESSPSQPNDAPSSASAENDSLGASAVSTDDNDADPTNGAGSLTDAFKSLAVSSSPNGKPSTTTANSASSAAVDPSTAEVAFPNVHSSNARAAPSNFHVYPTSSYGVQANGTDSNNTDWPQPPKLGRNPSAEYHRGAYGTAPGAGAIGVLPHQYTGGGYMAPIGGPAAAYGQPVNGHGLHGGYAHLNQAGLYDFASLSPNPNIPGAGGPDGSAGAVTSAVNGNVANGGASAGAGGVRAGGYQRGVHTHNGSPEGVSSLGAGMGIGLGGAGGPQAQFSPIPMSPSPLHNINPYAHHPHAHHPHMQGYLGQPPPPAQGVNQQGQQNQHQQNRGYSGGFQGLPGVPTLGPGVGVPGVGYAPHSPHAPPPHPHAHPHAQHHVPPSQQQYYEEMYAQDAQNALYARYGGGHSPNGAPGVGVGMPMNGAGSTSPYGGVGMGGTTSPYGMSVGLGSPYPPPHPTGLLGVGHMGHVPPGAMGGLPGHAHGGHIGGPHSNVNNGNNLNGATGANQNGNVNGGAGVGTNGAVGGGGGGANSNNGGGVVGDGTNGPSANNRKLGLYKTELCRSWEEKGSCRYGPKCQFAHGEEEIRKVARHPKYKTEICRTFWVSGSCPYGKRCCFIHTELPAPGAPGNPNPPAPGSTEARTPGSGTGPVTTSSTASGTTTTATPSDTATAANTSHTRSTSTGSDPSEQPASLLARISAKRTNEFNGDAVRADGGANPPYPFPNGAVPAAATTATTPSPQAARVAQAGRPDYSHNRHLSSLSDERPPEADNSFSSARPGHGHSASAHTLVTPTFANGGRPYPIGGEAAPTANGNLASPAFWHRRSASGGSANVSWNTPGVDTTREDTQLPLRGIYASLTPTA